MVIFILKQMKIRFKIIWQATGNTKASAPDSILDYLNYVNMKDDKGGSALLSGERVYTRILIKKVEVDED